MPFFGHGFFFVVGVVNKSSNRAYDHRSSDGGKSPSEHDARRKCNTYQHVYVNVTDFNVEQLRIVAGT